MPGPHSWNVVTPADSGEVVVAVDFPVTGRPEAGFPELAARLEPGAGFWQTVPPVTMPGSGVTGADYLRGWSAELADAGLIVRGVLGFCVGSVYAAVLADDIAARQGEPPALVLFDPELATVPTLRWQFEKMVGNLAGVLTEQEVAATRRRAGELAESGPPDVTGFAATLFAEFRTVAYGALVRLGLDDDRIEEVLDLFGSFISYLSVADQLDPTAGWRQATAISSASPLSGLNPRRSPAGEDSELVGRELRFPTEHAELLRSGDVAEAVVKLLHS